MISDLFSILKLKIQAILLKCRTNISSWDKKSSNNYSGQIFCKNSAKIWPYYGLLQNSVFLLKEKEIKIEKSVFVFTETDLGWPKIRFGHILKMSIRLKSNPRQLPCSDNALHTLPWTIRVCLIPSRGSIDYLGPSTTSMLCQYPSFSSKNHHSLSCTI